MRRSIVAGLFLACASAVSAQVPHAEAFGHQQDQGTLLRLRENVLPPLDCKQVIGPGDPKPVEGKVSILFFWRPWCPPCKASLELLGELHRSGRTDLHVGSAAFIDPSGPEVAAARQELAADIERHKASAPVCVYEDPSQETAWGAEGVPVLVMFDKARKPVRVIGSGPRTLDFLKLVGSGWPRG
jgi:thiol-disulfide isomerase/thioredoxin